MSLLQKTISTKCKSGSTFENAHRRTTICLRLVSKRIFNFIKSEKTHQKCSQVSFQTAKLAPIEAFWSTFEAFKLELGYKKLCLRTKIWHIYILNYIKLLTKAICTHLPVTFMFPLYGKSKKSIKINYKT